MSRKRIRITLDVPKELKISDALEHIADDVARDHESGTIEDGESGEIHWSLRPVSVGVEIDRRQRLAAAMLVMAFDLPQEAIAASHSIIEASEILPGMTTGDMSPMGEHGRRAALETARALINDMLAEMPAT